MMFNTDHDLIESRCDWIYRKTMNPFLFFYPSLGSNSRIKFPDLSHHRAVEHLPRYIP